MADEMKNVELSILERIEDELESETTVHYQGTDFDTTTVTEWVQPRLLGQTPRATRLAERFELWTLNVNCFAETGIDGKSTHRIWELADAVIAAFNQLNLAIKNWAAPAKPTLFYLRFGEAAVQALDAPTNEADRHLQQVNVRIPAFLIA